jgi:hypothetical protein
MNRLWMSLLRRWKRGSQAELWYWMLDGLDVDPHKECAWVEVEVER